jgi:glycosyltransferase involved in cell wall biosynthesis
MAIEVLFLAWDSPWPAHYGGAFRTLGLLTELSAAFEVELLVLVREPLRVDQRAALASVSARVTEIPLRDATLTQRLRNALWGAVSGRPYHCAVIESSLRAHPDVRRRLQDYPGVVYASYGHWGTLASRRGRRNWILDQQHANVDFWRTYRSLMPNPAKKLFGALNERLVRRHFRDIYVAMGRIVSVCEEDRGLTLDLAPRAHVDIIPNGVDCVYFEPDRGLRPVGVVALLLDASRCSLTRRGAKD